MPTYNISTQFQISDTVYLRGGNTPCKIASISIVIDTNKTAIFYGVEVPTSFGYVTKTVFENDLEVCGC
jgi:hypothetical protein